MHGAAIVHGVFMAKGSISIELKTLYGNNVIIITVIIIIEHIITIILLSGYTSILFGIVAVINPQK